MGEGVLFNYYTGRKEIWSAANKTQKL